ncbi:DEAD/DEAH box helicase [Lichenifustis flavocetrariae]|uniref:DEAD/DEAH box helicase n=1 Tax=Lichenifustis flavocetrariae TaxID=2949735 RepID=A0AA41YWX5_9HYPH|nr:DEAD/DEAH box helicase [Lichenifustis flavocetrariae]MCW6510094.1 DEAD/DEAH box helicase [Lichenifustis flavocetrariae]
MQRSVSANAFKAGQVYRSQRRVLSMDLEQDGTLSTRVIGNERKPYTQTITLEPHAGWVDIEGHCSCPVGLNCKHVAAALLEGLAGIPNRGEAAVAQSSARVGIAHPIRAVPEGPQGALSSELLGWLDDLDRARATADETYPATVAQRIVYVLAPLARGSRAAQLMVKPISARLLKDGRYSDSGRPYAPDSVTSGQPAKFLRPSDIRILAALARLRRETYTTDLLLARETAAPVLADILATDRAHWLSTDGPRLAPGGPRPARLVWTSHDGQALRPIFEAADDLVVLNATPPVYVDAKAGLIGPLETGFQPKIAAALLDAPPVPADRIAAFTAALRQRAPDLAAVGPVDAGPPDVVEVAPVPCLRLLTARLPVQASAPFRHYGHEAPLEPVGIARLSFRYGPAQVAPGEPRARLSRIEGGRVLDIRRDLAAERGHSNALGQIGFLPLSRVRPQVPPAHAHDFVPEGDDMGWLDAIYHDLPRLSAEGWQIEVADDFPFRLLRGDGAVQADIRESSGIDWFEFSLGLMVDGERIDLVDPIVSLIGAPSFDPDTFQGGEAEDEPFYLPLGDGRILAVPLSRIASIVAAIHDLAAGALLGEGRLRLRLADAVGLASFEEATLTAGLVWRGGEALRQMGRKLGSKGIPEAGLPASFRATLRPYQQQGVSWLAFLRDVGLGGVLADDMGLGKTVQALALLAMEKAEGRLDRPALVVAPTSLMANWRREAERFVPDLRVLVLHGFDRKTHFDAIGTSDLVLTTYPLIGRDHGVLNQTSWHMLILDEAQTIKNPEATTTKLIGTLDARHRFCLSGTPLENNLGELWSLFSFVLPGFLGDRTSFTRQWRTPIEKGGDSARARMLARRIKPFLLRRTKEEVASDLPAKTEIIERVEFGQAQRDIYEAVRLSMHALVQEAIASKGFARSQIVILDALLKMRQASCDPRLLKPTPKAAGRAGSAKLERLEELLRDLLAEKRRILIFSQFTSMLALIRLRLDISGTPYVILTGQTRDRDAVVRAFQEGEVPVFLVSLKAGGTGLNLTAADTVILYDPWWNPAVEDQAIDRAHRIGQDKPVFVHKLVASGTIEEKMEILKDRKRALADSMLDQDSAQTLAMTESDLDMLFGAG